MYTATALVAFPNATWNSANYWVDVSFTTTTTTTAAPATALTAATADPSEASDSTTSAATADDASTARRVTDTDEDGLPDRWESQFGLAADSPVGDDGADGDPDGDGVMNLDEFTRGSHPRGLVKRYLAEGVTGSDVRTHLVLANPGAGDATLLVSFSDANGQTTRVPLTLSAGARRALDVGAIPALAAATFSTVVESDLALTVERRMLWARGAVASVAPAIEGPATHWYFARGSTQDPFELYYLVQNPGDTPADVQVRYLLPDGAASLTRAYTVAPGSRATIWVDRDDPALAGTDVAAEILSLTGAPIVVERSMYVTSGQPAPAAVESRAGVTAAAPAWTFDSGGDSGVTSLVIVNPGTEPAVVEVTAAHDGHRREAPMSYVVAAGGRISVKVTATKAGADAPAPVIDVRSTTGAPIVVERSGRWR